MANATTPRRHSMLARLADFFGNTASADLLEKQRKAREDARLAAAVAEREFTRKEAQWREESRRWLAEHVLPTLIDDVLNKLLVTMAKRNLIKVVVTEETLRSLMRAVKQGHPDYMLHHPTSSTATLGKTLWTENVVWLGESMAKDPRMKGLKVSYSFHTTMKGGVSKLTISEAVMFGGFHHRPVIRGWVFLITGVVMGLSVVGLILAGATSILGDPAGRGPWIFAFLGAFTTSLLVMIVFSLYDELISEMD